MSPKEMIMGEVYDCPFDAKRTQRILLLYDGRLHSRSHLILSTNEYAYSAFGLWDEVFLATPEEKEWLLACKEAKKTVSRPKKSTHYEIY